MSDIHPCKDLRGGFCIETKPEPCGLVVFGASGDLAHRKLIPALFGLFEKGLLPDEFFVLGCARTPMTDSVFQNKVREALERSDQASPSSVDRFASRCGYISGTYHEPPLYTALKQRLEQLGTKPGPGPNHIFYLATPPDLCPAIVSQLASAGLTPDTKDTSPRARVVVEKPFGRDLESAIALNAQLRGVLSERQIYRIDHYLGKETVQNILMLRFANTIFEPIWNRRYIDHVQITVSEELGVEHRAGYFEQAGLFRDMFQNHMLEMLALVAMEAPISFEADVLRDEKVKLLRSIRPFALDKLGSWTVRGQYGPGRVGDQDVPGYRQEKGVARDSIVETYVAAKLLIDNWRWQDVPFYVRAGKRLKRKVSEIAITFKSVPHSMFAPLTPDQLAPNVLALNVQPDEGITLSFQAKHPGPKLCMTTLKMAFDYHRMFATQRPDAYERLLLDCMLADPTLFVRQDSMEAAWSLITPVLEVWETTRHTDEPFVYPAGSWGPSEADALLQADGRAWRTP